MGIVLIIILACIYLGLPFWLQFVLMVINFLLPDPIYLIDEIIMVGSTISKLGTLADVSEFIAEHKILSCIIGCVLLVLIIWGLNYFI